MDEYVKAQLYHGKKQKDAALDAMIYEERKAARKEFTARLAKARARCQRCKA
jgi:hypothetical protein